MSILHDIKMILSLSCEKSSRLLSDELERPLSRVERAALRIHLMLCHRCRRFRRHLQQLRAMAQHLTAGTLAGEDFLPPLSPAARARINEAITRAQSEGS
jgi:hypothetical protein